MRWGRPGQGWTYSSVQQSSYYKRLTASHRKPRDKETITMMMSLTLTNVSLSPHPLVPMTHPLMMLCMDQWPDKLGN